MTSKILLCALGLGLFLVVSGCSSTPTAEVDSSAQQNTDNHSGHNHDQAGKTDMEKMNEALADFSEDDRNSALKQHFCPISGGMLGTMGEPEKVEVKGRQVWICCDGCKDKLLADPDKYLAKLND